MAIKRTTQRRNYIQNIGIADTGAKDMANATLNLSKIVGNITADVDQAQLKTAYLEAEKQGKIIGARTDKDGKVLPLDQVSLDQFNPSILNQANKRQAIERYKNFAISSYKSAVVTDALDSASNSFNTHQGKMADNNKLAVFNDSQKYVQALESKLPSEVWSAIGPSVNEAWSRTTRKASALHLDGVRKQNLLNGSKLLEALNQNEADARSGLGGHDLENIEQDKQEAFALIKENVSSEAQYTNIVFAYNSNLQARVSSNAIDSAVIAKVPLYEQRQMVDDTIKRFTGTGLDTKVIADAMNARITYHERIRKDKKAADVQQQQSDYFTMINTIYAETNPAALPSALEITAKFGNTNYGASLQSIISGRRQNLEKLEQSKFGEDGILKLINLSNPGTTPDDRKEVDEWFESNRNNLPKRVYQQWVNDKVKHNIAVIKSEKAQAMQPVLDEMKFGTSFTTPPVVFANSLDLYRKSGLVGNSATAVMTETQYNEALIKYTQKYNQYKDLVSEVNQGFNNNSAGASTTPNQQAAQKKLGNNILYPTKVFVNGQKVDLDIVSSDTEVAEKSMIASIQYMIKNRTVLPEGNIVSAMKNFATLEPEKHEQVLRFYKTLVVTAGNYGLDKAYVNHHILKDIDTELLDIAATLNVPKETLERVYLKKKDKSMARIESMFTNKNQSLDEVFTNTLKNLSDDYVFSLSGYMSKFFKNAFRLPFDIPEKQVNDVQRLNLERFNEITRGQGFFEAVNSNPVLRSRLFKSFRFNLMSDQINIEHGVDKALNQAMSMTLAQVMENVGLKKNSDGISVLTMYPPVSEFQKTVDNDIANITETDVNEYIFEHFSNVPALRDRDTQNAFANRSFKIVPNEVAGDRPSYRIYVEHPGGKQVLLSNNFIFDWKHSPQNKAYQIAMNQLKNDNFGTTLYRAMPGLDRIKLKSLYRSWNEGMSDQNFLKGLVNLYNNTMMALTPGLIKDSDLIDPDGYTIAKARALLLTLGMDPNAWKMNPDAAKSVIEDD
ncbi:MAG: hypothetical protein GOVbin3332_18 [Prokaryotic dsDNA virus sp.]|nr:MAG: hypothetical protein GOVbin3332_18 [Prokaryotic dsDNA virus sp.]|tara:strand:- start:4153 stop:7179 length:3027 start_codon:yes stop_codon:yes gene_type:complete